MIDVAPTPAHLALRQSTRTEHAAAEQAAVMRALLEDRLRQPGYLALLNAQHALHGGWESARSAWLAELAERGAWRYHSRLPSLRQDLREQAAAPADSFEAFATADRCTAWGELYVIEGSALGGQLLARRLRGLFPAVGHHFFGHGEHRTVPWRDFQRALDQALPDPASQQAAVRGARAMFARFQRALEAIAV